MTSRTPRRLQRDRLAPRRAVERVRWVDGTERLMTHLRPQRRGRAALLLRTFSLLMRRV
jgi:hypothetical protein